MTPQFIEVHGAGGETFLLNTAHVFHFLPVNAARAKLLNPGKTSDIPLNAKTQAILINGLSMWLTDDYATLASKVGILVGLG